MGNNFRCDDCGGDCNTLLAAMQRSLAAAKVTEPTASEMSRFLNPGVDDEYYPEED